METNVQHSVSDPEFITIFFSQLLKWKKKKYKQEESEEVMIAWNSTVPDFVIAYHSPSISLSLTKSELDA